MWAASVRAVLMRQAQNRGRASPAEGAGANTSTFSQTMENDILCQTPSVGQNDMYSLYGGSIYIYIYIYRERERENMVIIQTHIDLS
jgi:hypothetical protein